jgi:hypothetical protein
VTLGLQNQTTNKKRENKESREEIIHPLSIKVVAAGEPCVSSSWHSVLPCVISTQGLVTGSLRVETGLAGSS